MTTREVVLDGGSPWGFRMHGGADVQQPLRISRVNPGSKAANKGIREGDLITSINNEPTRGKTNADAHALLKNVGDTLKLGLNEDNNASPKRRQYKTVHQETRSEIITTQSELSSTSFTSVNITKEKNEVETETNSKPRNDVKVNGNLKLDRKGSEVSTISSSTCSSTLSTPSTLTTESQVKSCDKTKMPEQAKERERWVGIATDEDPKVVVCLSPTQKDHLETTKKIPDEAGKLLDLHNKFMERRTYHDDVIKNSVSEDGAETNRLLAIIRDSGKSESPENMYLYYEEKEQQAATLPLQKKEDNPRLSARNLSEWLQLARDKSKSDTQLNKNPPVIAAFNIRRGSASNLDVEAKPMRPINRRQSLPQEFYVQQMQYLIEKEKEIQLELEVLEEEKRKLTSQMMHDVEKPKNDQDQKVVTTDRFRQNMYDEYMQQVAAREERKQLKVIKLSSHQQQQQETKKDKLEATHVTGIEDEFMDQVKKRRKKYGIPSEESGGEGTTSAEKSDLDDVENIPVLVMDGESIRGAKKLPKHLKEFVEITQQQIIEDPEGGIWSPGQQQQQQYQQRPTSEQLHRQKSQDQEKPGEPIPPVWTPKSAGSSPILERKEFRPVSFESPTFGRKNKPINEFVDSTPVEPPWTNPRSSSDTGVALSSSLGKRIPNSYSAPASGFSEFSTPRLPRAQNPTITLLQKAREGQLPKGASYIEYQEQPKYSKRNESPPHLGPGEILYHIKNEYTSDSESGRPRRMADLGARKFEGIGPTTKDGMPIILRSEVRDQNQSKWYKRMYDTIHKQKPRYDDDYVMVRYKQRRGRYPYMSGYLSEPEPGAYDSDVTVYDNKYATLDRRRNQQNSDHYVTSYTMPRSSTTHSYGPTENVVKHGQGVYKNQPGRIENYVPGRSSISEKEAKEWWDEVMDIFDGHLEQQKQPPHKGYMSQALKESGYESDSTLIFRRRDDTANQLSPSEQREAYRSIQRGGDVPLHGLRKPAPERPKEPEAPIPPPKGQHGLREQETESPRKYVENEVTIHYRTPVRHEVKESLSEDELARRQAEHMKKIYQEERRRKYLQELQDMNSRRHTDNFIPSQKSPIPLNRYDDFVDDLSPKLKPRPKSPEPRLVAKALYNFVGQSARELTFRKGDVIYIRRQVDKNWYEGEHNAMIGLFPANYVEIVPYDGIRTTIRKPHEGQARAKYNFIAQTHLELSLAKGELVVITRRVDDNWFEGKIGGRKGIFPVSYVELLIEPNDPPPPFPQSKPVAAPAAHSILLNGSIGGKESMGSHNYVPPFQNTDAAPSYRAKPVQMTGSGTYGSLRAKNPVNQTLHIETQSEPIPYRALYKYKPQNDDELELLEGDTVYVLEKCDDGWFVGSSDRTGAFGTFPGNYVERI